LYARRLNVHGVAPTNASALWNVDACLRQCGLAVRLIALAKIRISRMNQCACGFGMRGDERRCDVEGQGRDCLLNRWWGLPLHTSREYAALGSTEPDIRITEPQPPGSHQDEVRRPFDDKDLVYLTTLIAIINLSNRLPISLRCERQTGVPA
jgi:alkylhydroperoxidase family enzyme